MAVSGYCCGVWHQCKGTHYRRVHQKFTTVTFLWDGQVMVVKRNKVTSQFNCPRCRKSFSEPSTLRKHCRREIDCRLHTRRRVLRYEPGARRSRSIGSGTSGADVRAPSEADIDQASDAEYVLDGASPSSGPSGASTQSTRPIRRGGPHTTRTQRALVRGYWKDEYTVHQIGEYMNLSRSDIWHAIKNQSGDDLDEDEAYRDGTVGDVINVENLLLDIEVMAKVEGAEIDEVDEKVEVELPVKEEAYDSDMEFELINAEPAMRSPRSEPMQRSPQPSQSSISMFNTISATNSSNPTLISRLPTPPLSSRSAAGPSSLPDATQTSQSDGMENLNSSTANGSGPGRSQVDETDPIHTFLNQLKRPLAHLTDAFRDFGVVKGEDLDVLCELKDQWTFLQACLGDAKKVTPLEWMIIKAGLEGRAARLRK